MDTAGPSRHLYHTPSFWLQRWVLPSVRWCCGPVPFHPSSQIAGNSQKSSELNLNDLLWRSPLVSGLPVNVGNSTSPLHLGDGRRWQLPCFAEPTAPLGYVRYLVCSREYFWPLPRNKIEPQQVCPLQSRAALQLQVRSLGSPGEPLDSETPRLGCPGTAFWDLGQDGRTRTLQAASELERAVGPCGENSTSPRSPHRFLGVAWALVLQRCPGAAQTAPQCMQGHPTV